MKVVIATSGEGGHLFCGLGFAAALLETMPDAMISFFGSGGAAVRKLTDGKGFGYYKIYSAGLLNHTVAGILKFAIGQAAGIIQSGFLLFRIRPDVVVSTGGFVSIGAVVWSGIFGIPSVIHEQNLVPGKVNRVSARIVDKTLISFEKTREYFRYRTCIFTGMPVRFKTKIPAEEARRTLGLGPDKFTVLVMGGSSGARRINQIIVSMLDKMPRDAQFIHLTGRVDSDYVRKAYKKSGFLSHVEDFSNRMDVIYSASSVVICRAGSGTLSEIAFFGLPSVLIPYPYSSDRHQYKNAEYLEENGAAVVVAEEDMTIDRMAELMSADWRDKLKKMADKSAGLSMPFSAEKIAEEIIKSAKKNI